MADAMLVEYVYILSTQLAATSCPVSWGKPNASHQGATFCRVASTGTRPKQPATLLPVSPPLLLGLVSAVHEHVVIKMKSDKQLIEK